MAKLSFPYLPLHLLVRTQYDSLSRIDKISCPLLILHGSEDETIPISIGRRLYMAAREPKSFYEVVGASHNDTYVVGKEPYYSSLGDFITGLER